MDSIGMYRTGNKIYGHSQFVAPYLYCFYNAEGRKLGRIVWLSDVEGIYVDKDLNEWGL